jgi:RNA polymerase sigma factor (sigma-70 family)
MQNRKKDNSGNLFTTIYELAIGSSESIQATDYLDEFRRGIIDERCLIVRQYLPHIKCRIEENGFDCDHLKLTAGQLARRILDGVFAKNSAVLKKYRGRKATDFLSYLDGITDDCLRFYSLLSTDSGYNRGLTEYLQTLRELLVSEAAKLMARRVRDGLAYDPEDLVQDTFVKILNGNGRAILDYKGKCSIKSYLKKIMTNIYKDLWRRLDHNTEGTLERYEPSENNNGNSDQTSEQICQWGDTIDNEVGDGSGGCSALRWSGWSVRPDRQLEWKERADLVQKAIADTGKRYAVVLEPMFEGLKYREIAKELGAPAGTVAIHIKRGRDILKRIIPLRHRELMRNIPFTYRKKLFR